jgi:anti-anti-sigma factor
MLPNQPAPGTLCLSVPTNPRVAASLPTRDLIFTGELDLANCSEIEAAVERLCAQRCRVRIDLGAVTFIDAAVVGAFARARQCARAVGCDVVLANAHGLPLRVLRVVGLATLLVDEGASDG